MVQKSRMHQLRHAADTPDSHTVRVWKGGCVALEFPQQGSVLQRGADATERIQQVAREQPSHPRWQCLSAQFLDHGGDALFPHGIFLYPGRPLF
jgi:hypothetical protein